MKRGSQQSFFERRRETAGAFLSAAIAALLLIWFATANGIIASAFSRLALPLTLAAVTAFASLGAGALPRLLARGRFDADRLLSAVVVGHPLSGTIYFLAGCVSTSAAVMSAVLFGLAAFGAAALVMRGPRADGDDRSGRTGPAFAIALALLGVAAGHAAVVAQTPPVSNDELTYHLAVPWTWVLEGRVVDLPLLSHSYFPFGAESAALPALALLGQRGAIASHFLHVITAAAAMLLLFRWLRRRVSGTSAVIATLAVTTTPAMLISSGWTWTDWPLLGCSIALLVALDDARGDRGSSSSVALAVAAGLLTKYSFPASAVPLLLAAFVALPGARRLVLRGAAIGAVAGSVFAVRNLLFTGNPLAPFFEAHAAPVTRFTAGGFASRIFDPKLADEALGVTLVALVIASGASLLFSNDRFARWAVVSGGAAAAILFASGGSARIAVPALAIAAAAGWPATTAFHPLGRQLWAALLVTASALQLLFTVAVSERLYNPLGLLTTSYSEESYLSNFAFFPPSVWINANTPPDSRLLAVGLKKLFWMDSPAYGPGHYDNPRLSAYLDARDAVTLRERLRRDGFTHLVVDASGIRSVTGGEGRPDLPLTEGAVAAVSGLLATQTERVAAAGPLAIYRLR